LTINKLCLGTVQFGLDYGINNTQGKPATKDVFAILDEAISRGITCFDTAYAYGTAEELLGQYGINRYDVKVITKLKPNLIQEKNKNVSKIIEEQIRQSLQRISIEVLDGYLLHTPTDFYNPYVMDGLASAKEKGLIQKFGVSIYEAGHALDVVKSGSVDYIQIPYSIFDQRLDQTDFFEIARKNKVTVYGRSTFLQGLILMENLNIPEHLAKVKEYLQQYDEIIKKYGFSRVEAAFLFSCTHPGIDYVVFGVDNVEQLQENILLSNKKKDFSACRAEISSRFKEIEKTIIFPSLWSKK